MNKKLRLAFLIGLLVLVVNSIVPFVLAQRVAQRQATADLIATEVSLLRQLLGGYKDAETGVRGFVLSGQREFLTPYIAGRGAINMLLPEVAQSLARTQPETTVRELWQLDHQESAHQRDMIALRTAGKQGIGADFERGRKLMDALRALIGKQIDSANVRAVAAKASARQLEHWTRDISAVIAVLDVLLLGATFWFAMRLLRNEQYAAEATEMANQHLLTEGGLRHAAMQKLEAQADKLNKIIDTQTALAQTTQQLEEFLPVVVERMLQLTPATGAVIEMLEGDELVYVATSGTVAAYVGLRLSRGTSLSGLCIAEQKVMITTDTASDPRVNREACEKIGAAAMVVAPLFRSGEAVGVLKIVSDVANGFDDGDVQTLLLVAGLVGTALGDRLAFETNTTLLEERSRTLAEIRQQQLMLRTLTDNIPALVAFVDLDQRYQYTNQHFSEMIGKDPLGLTMREFVGDEKYALIKPHVDAALGGTRVEFENRIPTRHGLRYTQAHLIPEFDAAQRTVGLCIVAWDISARKEQEMKWQSRALVDQLTGARNRFAFIDAVGQALQQQSRLAVLYLDIDRFKSINDTCGHAAGDAVLCEFVAALKRALRTSDVVGRIGGDEFCILLDNIGSLDNARGIATKVLGLVRTLASPLPGSPPVTTSIGIAFVDSGNTLSAEEVIELADAALYEAKQGGRNRYAERVAGAVPIGS